MSRRWTLLALIAAIVAIIAAIVGVAVHQQHVDDRTLEVNGQRYPCGHSNKIRLTASVLYPDPDASFTLDGQQQPTSTDIRGVDLQMHSAPVYSCAEGRAHHLHIKSGEREPFSPGCSINLESIDPTVLNGRNIIYQVEPHFMSEACDLTWTA